MTDQDLKDGESVKGVAYNYDAIVNHGDVSHPLELSDHCEICHKVEEEWNETFTSRSPEDVKNDMKMTKLEWLEEGRRLGLIKSFIKVGEDEYAYEPSKTLHGSTWTASYGLEDKSKLETPKQRWIDRLINSFK